MLCVSWLPEARRRPKSRPAPRWTFSTTVIQRALIRLLHALSQSSPPKARTGGRLSPLFSLLRYVMSTRVPALSAETISCCSAESSLLAPAAAARLVTQSADFAAFRASSRSYGTARGRNGELLRSGQRTDRDACPRLAVLPLVNY